MNIDKYRQELINLALDQYHKPYEEDAHGPYSFDHAGLIWYLYNEILGINVYKDGYGKDSSTQIMTSSYGKLYVYEENLKKLEECNFKLGDILFFHRKSFLDTEPKPTNKYPGYCGIYIGEKDFIHCHKDHSQVVIGSFYHDYWNKCLVGKKDIFEDEKVLKIIK